MGDQRALLFVADRCGSWTNKEHDWALDMGVILLCYKPSDKYNYNTQHFMF